MKFKGELPSQESDFNGAKREQQQKLTPEILRQKIRDPFWLPNYTEISKIIDSYFDKQGVYMLGTEEKNKWNDFLIENTSNPIFEIWTKEYIERFSNYLSMQAALLNGTKEKPIIILEVGAGNGKLSYFLNEKMKALKVENIKIISTDFESHHFKIKPNYDFVENLSEKDALKKYNPDIVICSWMMYGEDWTPDFRKTESIKEYILIGPEGPCGTDETWHNHAGFKAEMHPELSEAQISRTDILNNPKRIQPPGLKTRTVSFKRGN